MERTLMDPVDDTIAAIATAPGAAGLAVVRLSGRSAIAIADAIFRGRRALAEVPSHTLHHGWAVWPEPSSDREQAGAVDRENGAARPAAADGEPDPERRLDEVVAAVFRAPRSYTREDVIELSCHGGSLNAQRVLAALLRAGARLARPGEFTLRAFLNGRLDLAQAEAVADLIHAETESARTLALSQLAGELSRRLDALGERVADALSEVEARVDFAEDVGGIEVPPAVIDAIEQAAAELDRMLEGAGYARAVREGVRLPLVGRTNVGKSSLFNALVGEERAIVAPLPGTTRDRVSEAIEIAGLRLALSDTAGLRESAEPIETLGMVRAREAVSESPFALWVVDASMPVQEEDRWIAAQLDGKRVLVALNKCDLTPVVGEDEIARLAGAAREHRLARVSAARGDGIEELRRALAALLGADGASPALGAALANRRHGEALGRAREALRRAAGAGRSGAPGEIVALELREGLEAIGEVTGKAVGADLLDRIFSRFCIGK